MTNKLTLLLGLLPLALSAQTFMFTADTLTRTGLPGELIVLDGTIKNLSAQPLQVRVQRMQNNLPQAWSTSLCSADLCYPPNVDAYTIPDTVSGIPALAPHDSTAFHLNFNTAPATPGRASVPVRVENLQNPDEFVVLTFTASTDPSLVQEESSKRPRAFHLYANHPNPFAHAQCTVIAFEIGGTRSVPTQIQVSNLLGQEVATLLRRQLGPGRYEILWEGRDRFGNNAPPGIYFYTLHAATYRATRKLVLVR